VVEAALNNKPVVQPTGQQMLRYWQALMSVKDSQYPRPLQRQMTVSRPVVQVRLSVPVVTAGGFLLAIVTAVMLRCVEPRDPRGKVIDIPSTQLDWIVLAASEYRQRCGECGSAGWSSKFAMEHDELGLVVKMAPDGGLTSRIVSSDQGPGVDAYSDADKYL
jgi:hypothetical protein